MYRRRYSCAKQDERRVSGVGGDESARVEREPHLDPGLSVRATGGVVKVDGGEEGGGEEHPVPGQGQSHRLR